MSQAFEDNLSRDLARAVDLDPENFCVLKVSPGSVIVHIEILGTEFLSHLDAAGEISLARVSRKRARCNTRAWLTHARTRIAILLDVI